MMAAQQPRHSPLGRLAVPALCDALVICPITQRVGIVQGPCTRPAHRVRHRALYNQIMPTWPQRLGQLLPRRRRTVPVIGGGCCPARLPVARGHATYGSGTHAHVRRACRMVWPVASLARYPLQGPARRARSESPGARTQSLEDAPRASVRTDHTTVARA